MSNVPSWGNVSLTPTPPLLTSLVPSSIILDLASTLVCRLNLHTTIVLGVSSVSSPS